ncbi:hypothetical protein LY78DRAFT_154628 [Colletotrichum sublineola]|nr:hypothetical protein LY78DRAFT_154628 [Colletotrichum sublineola]
MPTPQIPPAAGMSRTSPKQMFACQTYTKTTFDCFINQLYTRLTSIFLPDTDHSDYLVDQIFDIQDVCNITACCYGHLHWPNNRLRCCIQERRGSGLVQEIES